MQVNRRQFGRLALLGAAEFTFRESIPLSAQSRLNSTFGGVQIGCDSYSFRDRNLEDALSMMADVGFGTVELWYDHIEYGYGGRTERASREDLRRWRLSVPLDEFETASDLAAAKGMAYSSYNFKFSDDVTDAEISRVFEMATAIGAEVVTGVVSPTTVARVDAEARKRKMRFGIKNTARQESDIVTAEDIEAARRGASDYVGIALDVGDLTSAGGDPVDFIDRHQGDIVAIYLKDREKDNGPAVPFGQGDTPMREVLSLLREQGSSVPVNIRYEYSGEDTFRETREGYRFCEAVLG